MTLAQIDKLDGLTAYQVGAAGGQRVAAERLPLDAAADDGMAALQASGDAVPLAVDWQNNNCGRAMGVKRPPIGCDRPPRQCPSVGSAPGNTPEPQGQGMSNAPLKMTDCRMGTVWLAYVTDFQQAPATARIGANLHQLGQMQLDAAKPQLSHTHRMHHWAGPMAPGCSMG